MVMACHRLSAEELMEYFNGPVTELPQKGGAKDYAPDGSWLQAKQIAHFYKERRDVLSEERVKKKGHLSHGEWRPELGLVEIIGKTGKFWQTTGHVEDGKFYLYPEEALALVDKGDIEVYHGGLPMSLQECYPTLLGDNIPMEHYLVYIHLSRLGYVIFRHQPVEKISAYEQKIGLGKLSGKTTKKRKAKSVELRSKLIRTDNTERDGLEIAKTASDSSNRQAHEGETKQGVKGEQKGNCQDLDNRMQCDSVKLISAEPTHIVDGEDCNEKLGYSDFSRISFPSLVPGMTCELERPRAEYLPSGISLQEDNYVLTWSKCGFAQKSSSEQGLEFSHPPSTRRTKVNANNWREYKEMVNRKSDEDVLLESPVGHLWKGEVKPLIKPSEARSTVSLLERMKIIQNLNFAREADSFAQCRPGDTKIAYDVYRTKGQFSKKSPGRPVFRLCIKRQDDRLVSLADMVQASKLSPDGVPVQWAIVDNGDVTFYAFHGIDLPTDVALA